MIELTPTAHIHLHLKSLFKEAVHWILAGQIIHLTWDPAAGDIAQHNIGGISWNDAIHNNILK